MKAHVGIEGNEDADGVAKEAVHGSWIRKEQLEFSVGTVKRLSHKWAMREWAKKWRSLKCETSDLKRFFSRAERL